MLSHDLWTIMRDEVGPEFTDTLPRFVRGMADRMIVSAFKYGPVTPDLPKHRNMMETIKLRLAKYEETHNTEYLMDVANFCLMEFVFPSYPDAYFRPTDSGESPGIVAKDGTVTHTGDEQLLAWAKQRREIRKARRE